MTYYGARNLAESFRTVRNNTITLAEEIPEDKYGFKATPDTRSIGETLAHMAASPMWQLDAHANHVATIDFAFFGQRMQESAGDEQALIAGGKAAIVAALRERGDKIAAFLQSLDEKTLAETVTFPPPIQPATKARFEMLLGLKEHEMHHRGQLMLIQRMIGIVPHLTRARQERQQQLQAAGR